MHTLDTNAIIYYLKDDAHAVFELNRIFALEKPIYVSAITEIELFGFPNLTTKEENLIQELFQTLAVIPVDSRIARIAGTLRRGYGLKLPDSAIAATALFTGSILLSRNMKDFQRVPNLSLKRV